MARYVQVRFCAAALACSILAPLALAASPDAVIVTMSKPQFTVLESPSGNVKVVGATGAPLANVTVTITHVSGLVRHSIVGTTNATGEFLFDLGLDATARTPGPHDVFVTAATPVTSFGHARYLVLSPA